MVQLGKAVAAAEAAAADSGGGPGARWGGGGGGGGAWKSWAAVELDWVVDMAPGAPPVT